MNELRISDEDRLSFTKFVRDSISYAVTSRFKLDYPMDKELLKENFTMLDSISLMSLGETVSDIIGYQRGQISLYKVRGILSSFYKNQNTLKFEYY